MDIYSFHNLTIYRSIFKYLQSNMYVIIDENESIIIDPHENDEIFSMLRENSVEKVIILLTHEHTDHISGIHWLKEEFNTTVICQNDCAEYISDNKSIRPLLISFVLEEQDKEKGTHLLDEFNNNYIPYTTKADITFGDSFEYSWNNYNFKFKSLKGHSNGSCIINLNNKILFTGDTLLKEYPIITRFPGGCKEIYKNSTIPYLGSLDENLIIFPGHGDKFELKEMKNNGKLHVEFR